ncbi:MAG: hypothetical protein M1812_003955 [Candelaria pacifica]|nr:MAG: hypothetical protein M1812_003955 [Candelaria pacifica]
MSSSIISQPMKLRHRKPNDRYTEPTARQSSSADLVEAKADIELCQPRRSFQFLKTYSFRVFPSAILVVPTGGTTSSISPAYRTGHLSYWHKPGLAPSFDVLNGASGPSNELPIAKIMYKG